MSDNNNQPPPDLVFGAEKNRAQRETPSSSVSSTGTTSSASAPFTFGAITTGLHTSQAEPLRFGSYTVPGFGASSTPSFGQTSSTVTASAIVSAPITSQPFQFGSTGNSPFQFVSANTNTSSNTQFGFGGSSAKESTHATTSPFQLDASNTTTGNTSTNTAPFGTIIQSSSSAAVPATKTTKTTTTITANTSTFGAAPKRQDTIQIDDDSMSEGEENEDSNNTLVLANQSTLSDPSSNKPSDSFGSTPPPKKEGSGSSTSSTPLQQKIQRQQASEFFSIVSTEQSNATPSSPLVFISPGSSEEINIKKPSSQPTFNKEDEGTSSRPYGATLAHLEDPFNSSPIQKAVDSEPEKNDVVVIQDLDDDNDKEKDKEESNEQKTSKEPIAEDKEYQVVEPEEANVELEDNITEKEDTVEVSTESVEQENRDESSEAEKKEETSNEEAPIEIEDSSDEEADPSKQADKEKTDDQPSNTQKEQEKPTAPSLFTKNTSFFSNAEKSKESGSEEPKKASPLFPGFNFGSQNTSTETPTNKPPPIIFGNASTATPDVEKPPAFTGFNFGGEAAKLKTTITPFGQVQIPPTSKENTAGGAIKKKRSTRAGLPYDKLSSKHTEVHAPVPQFSVIGEKPGFSKVSSKSPIVEEGPKETRPIIHPFSQTTKVSPSKNPFAGINFTSSGSENTTQAVSSDDKTLESSGTPQTTGVSPFGSFSGSDKETTKTAPPFTFGGPALGAKEPSKAPTLSFGGAGDKTKEPAKTPVFSFGSTGNKDNEPTKTPAFSFGSTGDKDKEPAKTPAFSFGSTGDKDNEPTKTPAFSFGSTGDKDKEPAKTPAFSFGSTGDKDKEPAKSPVFSFGSTSEKDKEPVKVSAFSFGSASDKEPTKKPAFSFGSAGEAAKEAARASNTPKYSSENKSPFIFSTSKADSTPTFTFGSTSNETSKDSGSSIFKFGASETSALGSSSVSQERSNKKKRQLDSDEDDGPPTSKKSQFSFQMPSTSSSSPASNSKKRQLDNEDEDGPPASKKTSVGFTTPADNKFTFGGADAKEDISKETQDKENKSPDFAFGGGPEGNEEQAPANPEKTVTTPADLYPKPATATTTPALGTSVKKPSPLSKEITFASNTKSTTTKKAGSVAIAFSKKDVIENETLNVKPVKLISSELSAEIGTLKSDMISFSDEVLQTRFWQLSPEVQQNMTAFDAFVNAHIENFKRFENSRRPGVKDTLTYTTEKIKALSMDADNLSQMQKHITSDVEVFKKRVALQKCNINAAKEYKTEKNIYLQERDERINWQFMNHMANEMESRLEEYQQIIPSMEESISNMRADHSVSDIHHAIDDQGKILVKLAGRIAKTHDDVHTIRLTPHQ